jgi:hypothetical protein
MEAFLVHFPDRNSGWKASFGTSDAASPQGSLPSAFSGQEFEMEDFLSDFQGCSSG